MQSKSKVAIRELEVYAAYQGLSGEVSHGEITFLDLLVMKPLLLCGMGGITDIIVLVVAADDGVIPQTREAIDHAEQQEFRLL